jgi:hypothetical protein
MATTLAEIRAKLQANENRGGGNQQSGGDNAIYPHWNIAEGSTTRVRFLPDGNTKNSFFWAERAMIRLPFAGVKGQADSKPVVVQVPCMEMYGEACPVLAEVRPWFKDPSLEEMGRKYWKKKSYLFQGFVRENALSDDKTPENPIRDSLSAHRFLTLSRLHSWILKWKNCQPTMVVAWISRLLKPAKVAMLTIRPANGHAKSLH